MPARPLLTGTGSSPAVADPDTGFGFGQPLAAIAMGTLTGPPVSSAIQPAERGVVHSKS